MTDKNTKESSFIPQTSSFTDRWLSVDEIGDYLGIKRDTVYKWINEKDMPAHKIGRLWKCKKDEVDQWVRKGGGGKAVLILQMNPARESKAI